ncbi:endonuclease domain-containing protein [Geodermatophilus poikilotrophus]|uniref:endonuclease domain-containing protein n=1 Tax=Geodermatophilus poikilotrophus TaxID=1333667 RepID=UPI003CCBB605
MPRRTGADVLGPRGRCTHLPPPPSPRHHGERRWRRARGTAWVLRHPPDRARGARGPRPATGAVRALSCSNCNGGSGQFEDEPELLRAAVRHVERHRASLRSISSRRPPGDPRGQRRPGVSRDRRCSPGSTRWRAVQASS